MKGVSDVKYFKIKFALQSKQSKILVPTHITKFII